MRRALSLPTLFMALLAMPVGAVPVSVLTVQPGDANVGSVLVSPDTSDPQALAAAFALSAPFSNIDISANLTCLQCQVQFFLLQNAIGPGTDFVSNVRAVSTVDTLSGGGFINQSTPLFSGLDLDVGSYFLVMALTSQTLSGAIWSATQAPLVTAAAGASNLGDLMAFAGGYDRTTPALSAFQPYVVGGTPTSLELSLTSVAVDEPVAVPEPQSLLLLAAGLVALIVSRRRSGTCRS
jgi:PEP-CTERM motif-containing protein